MFKLVRWLFLLGVIAALSAFLVGKQIHGKTPAESFCKLIDSPDCAKLANRGATEVAWFESRWEAATAHPSAPPNPAVKLAERVTPRVTHAAPAPAPASPPTEAPTAEQPPAPPLDRHTPSERHALDKILSQRGSR